MNKRSKSEKIISKNKKKPIVSNPQNNNCVN